METINTRNFVGYGNKPPKVVWPSQARVAINFVINYEEGGESCILDGDSQSEHLLSDIIGADPIVNQRNLNMESLYEYGSRVGIHRLIKTFQERDLSATVFCVGKALEKNPSVAELMKKANMEVSSHGYRWLNYQNIPYDQEKEHIEKTIEVHQKILGENPAGIYQGKPSINTRKIIIDTGKFLYDSDSYSDELPYWVAQKDRKHLVIPYTLESNDMRFATANGFSYGEPFYQYLKDTFDCLYAEGADSPKMMSIGLHCRLVARPGRIQALKRFMTYLENFNDIWICKREEIAQHWTLNHS
jgi:allantoinase